MQARPKEYSFGLAKSHVPTLPANPIVYRTAGHQFLSVVISQFLRVRDSGEG